MEAKIQLALDALKKDQNLYVREVARLYGVSGTTLRRRRTGGGSRQDTTPPRQRLTELEEKTII